MKRNILQGQVYICDLNDGEGSEQCGERPCVIIQIDILNKTSKNVIIVPITSRHKKSLPTHVELGENKYGFLKCKHNTVLCENIRSISKERLKKYIGTIDKEDLSAILEAKEYAYIDIGKR